MNFKTILLGVIVVVILYLVWKYVFADNTNQSLSMGGSGKNKRTILANTLPGNPASIDFTFSIWLNDPKQPVFDIRTEKALGEHYKPEELKWDDAYSLKVMLEESPLIISNKSLNEIVNRINRLTH